MNYTTIEELKNAWIFKHKSLPISDSDKTKIKPMTANRAKVLWDGNISKQVDHPDFFKKGDWFKNIVRLFCQNRIFLARKKKCEGFRHRRIRIFGFRNEIRAELRKPV